MSISLSDQELQYIKQLLERQRPWWVRDKIIENIHNEEEREVVMSTCDHRPTSYIHESIACQLCGFLTETSETIKKFPEV